MMMIFFIKWKWKCKNEKDKKERKIIFVIFEKVAIFLKEKTTKNNWIMMIEQNVLIYDDNHLKIKGPLHMIIKP